MDTARRTARVFLFDSDNRLVLIKRTRPGRDPYWVLPGGGIEPGETPTEAVRREAFEELGARITNVHETVTGHSTSIQMLFIAKLVDMDPDARTGTEFTKPDRGTYDIERIPHEAMHGINLQPPEAAAFLRENPAVFSRT